MSRNEASLRMLTGTEMMFPYRSRPLNSISEPVTLMSFSQMSALPPIPRITPIVPSAPMVVLNIPGPPGRISRIASSFIGGSVPVMKLLRMPSESVLVVTVLTQWPYISAPSMAPPGPLKSTVPTPPVLTKVSRQTR